MPDKVQSIVNPKTGKYIRVNGPTYKDLLTDPKYAAQVKKAKRVTRPAPGSKTRHTGRVTKSASVNLPKTKPASLAKTLAALPPSRKTKKASLERSIERKKEGQGSSTRGWAAAAPQKGRERSELKAKCGDQCFLKPDNKGFPICPAPRLGQGCKVDCRGIIAAKVRAGEWNYKHVEEAAAKLAKKYNCE
jgi:hypothetical protein